MSPWLLTHHRRIFRRVRFRHRSKNRYLKFKLVVAALIVLLLAIIGGAITGIVYLSKRWLEPLWRA